MKLILVAFIIFNFEINSLACLSPESIKWDEEARTRDRWDLSSGKISINTLLSMPEYLSAGNNISKALQLNNLSDGFNLLTNLIGDRLSNYLKRDDFIEGKKIVVSFTPTDINEINSTDILHAEKYGDDIMSLFSRYYQITDLSTLENGANAWYKIPAPLELMVKKNGSNKNWNNIKAYNWRTPTFNEKYGPTGFIELGPKGWGETYHRKSAGEKLNTNLSHFVENDRVGSNLVAVLENATAGPNKTIQRFTDQINLTNDKAPNSLIKYTEMLLNNTDDQDVLYFGHTKTWKLTFYHFPEDGSMYISPTARLDEWLDFSDINVEKRNIDILTYQSQTSPKKFKHPYDLEYIENQLAPKQVGELE